MKRLICGVIVTLMVPFLTFVVSAQGYSSQETPDYASPERIYRIEELKEKITQCALGNDASPYGGGRVLLEIPLYQQEKTYYCGPATIQMVLDYFNITKSQNEIAEVVHTDSTGTMVYRMRDGLNELGFVKYEYVATDEIAFGTGLMYSINNNVPVICHVKTGTLPNYADGKDTGHYVVADGYMWAQGSSAGGTSLVYYNDPHYNDKYFGSYSCGWEVMEGAIERNAGYYIMSTQLD